MTKKIILIAAIVSLSTGCGYIGSKFPESKQLPRQQTCSELKRKLIFNKSTLNEQLDSTQQAEIAKLYRKYNCE